MNGLLQCRRFREIETGALEVNSSTEFSELHIDLTG